MLTALKCHEEVEKNTRAASRLQAKNLMEGIAEKEDKLSPRLKHPG